MLAKNQNLSQEEVLRYSRHLLIPEVGLKGQQELKNSSVLIIGAGGLGSPIAMYLAAAGVGRIGLVDFDVVDRSNLQRQIIHGINSLDSPKVESARERMMDLNPSIVVDIYNENFTSVNALSFADGYDLIIDATDNFPSRYLVNDLSVMLGIPNVYGSVFRFEGQTSVFDGSEDAPCYRCIFPSPPPPGLVPSCANSGVLGVVPGTIGTIQATEALKLLLGIGSTLKGRLLLYNALDMSFDYVKLQKNSDCKICSPNPEITELIDYEEFCGMPINDRISSSPEAEWDIDPVELAGLMENKTLQLVDVREPHELEISALDGAKCIPLGELASRLNELDSAIQTILFCRVGSRSRRALEICLNAKFSNVKHLYGGINAWAEQIDQTLLRY